METSTFFPDKKNHYLKNFKTECAMLDMNHPEKQLIDRVESDCQSWIPTGDSLIAQHPKVNRKQNENDLVKFTMSFADTFVDENSYVTF